MSTDYILSGKVNARDLFDGRLEAFGIREHMTSQTRRCLTDGHNYLWVYMTEDGSVGRLSRYGPDEPGKILDAISELFETDIFSEYEPQYWGFDTQEEWDAAKKQASDQARNEFYADVCAYVRGEANEIRPAPSARSRPRSPRRSSRSMRRSCTRKIRTSCWPGSTPSMTVTAQCLIALGPEDMALAPMLATHEDDLPKA